MPSCAPAPCAARYQESVRESFALTLHRLAREAGLAAHPAPAADEPGINFRGPAGTFPTVPYYEVLRGEVPPEIFRDRLVLVGATMPVLHDEFPTPFSGYTRMPGVEIHANFLETLLQGQTTHEEVAGASSRPGRSEACVCVGARCRSTSTRSRGSEARPAV